MEKRNVPVPPASIGEELTKKILEKVGEEVAKKIGEKASEEIAKQFTDGSGASPGVPVVSAIDNICKCGERKTLTKSAKGSTSDTYWFFYFQSTRDQIVQDVAARAEANALANAEASAGAFGRTFLCSGGRCDQGVCPTFPAVYVGRPSLTKAATVSVSAGFNDIRTTVSAIAEAECDVTVYCACM